MKTRQVSKVDAQAAILATVCLSTVIVATGLSYIGIKWPAYVALGLFCGFLVCLLWIGTFQVIRFYLEKVTGNGVRHNEG